MLKYGRGLPRWICAFWINGRVGIFTFCVKRHVLFFAKPDFFVPAFAAIIYSGIRRHKKGGVDGLGKLRSGAKRNVAILTFLICSEKGVTALRSPHRVGGG